MARLLSMPPEVLVQIAEECLEHSTKSLLHTCHRLAAVVGNAIVLSCNKKTSVVLKEYLEHEAKYESWEVLHLAAAYGHRALVAQLINSGTSVDLLDAGDSTPHVPLMYAAHADDWQGMMQLLIDKGANLDQDYPNQSFLVAELVKMRYLDEAIFLIEAGAPVNRKTNEGQTLMHLIWTNYDDFADALEFAQVVVDAGADLSAKDVWGNTPMHEAFQTFEGIDSDDWLAAIEIMDNDTVDINIQNNQGDTALMALCQGYHEDREETGPLVAQFIDRFKPDLEIEDNNGMTAAEIAIDRGELDAAGAIISEGGGSGAVEWLCDAMQDRNEELCTKLIELGVCSTRKDWKRVVFCDARTGSHYQELLEDHCSGDREIEYDMRDWYAKAYGCDGYSDINSNSDDSDDSDGQGKDESDENDENDGEDQQNDDEADDSQEDEADDSQDDEADDSQDDEADDGQDDEADDGQDNAVDDVQGDGRKAEQQD